MIYDIIHGYQPFDENLKLDWVQSNIIEVFYPTSISMAKGLIKQNVQLQGWTVDEWKKNEPLSNKVLVNLKEAYDNGNITLGCSLYNHALAPLLSEELLYTLIYIDYITINDIGKPIFFFPPELAVSDKVLKVLFENFDLIPIIPCTCVGSKKSEIVDIMHEGKKHRCFSANIFLKDTLMNGTVYQNIDYLPKGLSLKAARLSMRDPKYLEKKLDKLDKGELHIIPRDWENAESKDALVSKDGGKVVKGFSECRDEFMLISDVKASRVVELKDVIPASWEPVATVSNPFPYWVPEKKNIKADGWLGLIEIYEKTFEKAVFGGERNIKILKERLEDNDLLELIRDTSPALISCVPWHFLSRDEWDNDCGFAVNLIEKIVKPKLVKFVEAVYPTDEHLEKLIKINEFSNMIVR